MGSAEEEVPSVEEEQPAVSVPVSPSDTLTMFFQVSPAPAHLPQSCHLQFCTVIWVDVAANISLFSATFSALRSEKRLEFGGKSFFSELDELFRSS